MKKYIISMLPARERVLFKYSYESALLNNVSVNQTTESLCPLNTCYQVTRPIKYSSPYDYYTPALQQFCQQNPQQHTNYNIKQQRHHAVENQQTQNDDNPLFNFLNASEPPPRKKKSHCRSTCMKKYLLSFLPKRHSARIDFGLKLGNNRSIGQTELFVPFYQTDSSMLFADFRIMGDTKSAKEGNLGFGYRTIYGKRVYGVYLYGDTKTSIRNNRFYQGTIGFESLGEWTDIRLNTYWPTSKKFEIKSNDTINLNNQNYQPVGHHLIHKGHIYEIATRGIDIEFGFKIPYFKHSLTGYEPELRIFAGFYAFNHQLLQDPMFGLRLRAEARIDNVLQKFGIQNANLQIGAEILNDNIRHTNGYFETRLTIPLEKYKQKPNSQLQMRLAERVIRDVDIVSVASSPINPDTGQFINNNQYLLTPNNEKRRIFHVDQGTVQEGDGTYERPYSTTDLGFASINRDYDILLINKGNYIQGTSYKLNADHLTIMGVNYPKLLYLTGNNIEATNKSFEIEGIRLEGRVQDSSGISVNYTDLNKHSIEMRNVDIGKKQNGLNINSAASDKLDVNLHNVHFNYNSESGLKVIGNNNTTINIDSSSISNSLNEGAKGYGVYISGANFISKNSAFHNNYGSTGSNNIYVTNSPKVEIINSQLNNAFVDQNTAGSIAYGLKTEHTKEVIITDSTFDNNNASKEAYGYHASTTDKIIISGSSFSKNHSESESAVGLNIQGNTELSITKSYFNDNHNEEDKSAYGIRLTDTGTNVKISESEFSNNKNNHALIPVNYSAGMRIDATTPGNIVNLTGGVTISNPNHWGIHTNSIAGGLNLNLLGIGDPGNTTQTNNKVSGQAIGLRNISGNATITQNPAGQISGNTTDTDPS